MVSLVSYNFTIDDTSPLWLYSPYGDVNAIDGTAAEALGNSWVTWYSGSDFLQSLGESPSGDSYHTTSMSGASASLSFFGTGVSIYGISNASYQVTFDGAIRNISPSDGILFAASGESAGVHNVSIIANPSSSDQILQLNSAVVNSIGNSTSGTSNDLEIDNQNTTVITYTGDWTPNKTVAGIPSESSTVPFHTTSDEDASASLTFSGRSVALYGSSTSGHGGYGVVLDGRQTDYNGSSNWLLANMLMYYQDGLDESMAHTLVLQNLDGGETLSLSSVVIRQLLSPSSISEKDPQGAHSSLHAGMLSGIIVGSVAGVVVVAALVFCAWRRRQKKHNDCDAEDVKQVHGGLMPAPATRVLDHSGYEPPEVEGAITPYFLGIQTTRKAAADLAASASREPYRNEKGKGSVTPPHSLSPLIGNLVDSLPVLDSNNRPALVAHQAIRAPPRSVPATVVADDFSEASVSPVPIPQRLNRTQSSRRTLPNPGRDPAFVERVLEMVVQRIDGQLALDSEVSSHGQPLPPYNDDLSRAS